MFQKGVYSVLVTPFSEDGEVDYNSLESLLNYQLDAGIKNFVLLGTTSETPTLSFEEKLSILKFYHSFMTTTTKQIADDVFTVVGISGNNTKEVIKEAKELAKYSDAIMLSPPYYNKPPQRCIYTHYKLVAESIEKPLMVYNIPSRTGVNIELDTLYKLATTVPNILALKDASGSTEYIQKLSKMNFPDNFSVFSGDDSLYLEMKKYGAQGVLSVAANIVPSKVLNIYNTGNITGDMESLNTKIFIETNPIPVKFLLQHANIISTDNVRMPLQPLEDEATKTILRKVYISNIV